MPDSKEDKRRREQQSQHVAKGRECERHFSPVPLVGSRLGLTDDAGSFATVSRFVSVSSSSSRGVYRAAVRIVLLLPPAGQCWDKCEEQTRAVNGTVILLGQQDKKYGKIQISGVSLMP